MNVIIIGCGAMGCLFACLLKENGKQVKLIDHNLERVKKIKREGILITGIGGERKIKIDDIYFYEKDKDLLKEVTTQETLFIVFVKSYSTESAAKTIKSLIQENALVLTLQNGIGNIEILNSILGKNFVLGGTTAYGATVIEDGYIKHAGIGDTLIGEQDGKITERLLKVQQLFNSSNIKTKVTENLEGILWSKLLINSAINPLTAIFKVQNGKLIENEHSLQLMKLILEEGNKVSKGEKVEIIYDNIFEKVKEVCMKTAENVSSMLQDVLKKKRTEIDFINGAIVKRGKNLDIPTPVNELITSVIKAIESNY